MRLTPERSTGRCGANTAYTLWPLLLSRPFQTRETGCPGMFFHHPCLYSPGLRFKNSIDIEPSKSQPHTHDYVRSGTIVPCARGEMSMRQYLGRGIRFFKIGTKPPAPSLSPSGLTPGPCPGPETNETKPNSCQSFARAICCSVLFLQHPIPARRQHTGLHQAL